MMKLTQRGERVRDYGIVVLSGMVLAFPLVLWVYGIHV